MALVCGTCRSQVGAGDVTCPNCRNGFVSQLFCAECLSQIPSGISTCVQCDAKKRYSTPRLPSLVPRSSAMSSPAGPTVVEVNGASIPLPVHVAPSYRQSKFGVESEVTYNGSDAEILTLMSQAVTALHLLAGRMNEFQGIMQSTRDVIKGCRRLAADLQEEIEVRRGPQG